MSHKTLNVRAMVAPLSSVVGQSVVLIGEDGRVVGQLAVMAPAGPPPGVEHGDYVNALAADVAAKINAGRPQ